MTKLFVSKQIFFIYVSKYLLPVVETFLVDPGPLAEVPEVDLLYPVLLGPFEGPVGRERGLRSWLRCSSFHLRQGRHRGVAAGPYPQAAFQEADLS